MRLSHFRLREREGSCEANSIKLFKEMSLEKLKKKCIKEKNLGWRVKAGAN